ncbi:MAM and LDL-receptor class A domain-containing protein 1-like isoform X3 [Oculina patagonica]
MQARIFFLCLTTSFLVVVSHGFVLPSRWNGDCNFDARTFCKWRQERGDYDRFNWLLQNGKTPSSGTGPSKDNSGKGYYAYIETSSPRRSGDNARLISGPFRDVQCLHFSYSMIGDSIGSLNVYHNLHGQDLDIWSKKGPQRSSEWHSTNVTVYGTNYYIIFEAVVGSSYSGDIAIDDIYFTKGSCNGESFSFQNDSTEDTGGKCNFDLGLCDWANDLVGSDKSPWRLSTYRSSKRTAVQRPDHGQRLGGKFVYAMKSGRKASKHRLVSEKVCGPKCVEIFYFMEKFKRSEFRLLARRANHSDEDRVWFSSGDGTKTNDWTRAVVELNAEDETCFQLVLEANLRGELKSIVGLDDIFIANGSCCPMVNTPEDSAKANCNFDTGDFCNWRPSTKSTFLWSIGSGQTPSGLASGGVTGPTADSSGSGKYAFIESSEPQTLGDKAVLVSDMMAGQQCMRFKYYMHGEDVGSLSIYRRGFIVWKEIGNHGNQWLEGQVDFDCSMSQYQVEIEATVIGWRGDIAIDELTFTPGLCPIKSIAVAAGSHQTPPIPTTTPPIAPPHSICTFNKNLCGWTNAFNDDGEWHLHHHETPSFETGPQYDSDGNGYYIFMEASDLLKGQKIRLESREYSTPICLHFHYHMYGKDIGELRLEQRDLKNNSTKVIWSKTGQQEDNWHFGFQAFYGDHYTVSFVGVRGNSYLGDISLDEISVSEAEDCKVLEGLGTANDVVFNGDEGNCDFEKFETDCKWLNEKGDNFDWTIHSGRTPSSGTGPSFDHTKGQRGQGKYMYIESSSPRRKGHEAMLLIKLEGRAFCMRFWYHMYGIDTGSLSVMRIVKEPSDDHKPERKDFREDHVSWEKSGKDKDQLKDQWRQAEIELEVDRAVRKGTINWIAIVGTVGPAYRGDIAIDDIMFTEGRCSSKRRSQH